MYLTVDNIFWHSSILLFQYRQNAFLIIFSTFFFMNCATNFENRSTFAEVICMSKKIFVCRKIECVRRVIILRQIKNPSYFNHSYCKLISKIKEDFDKIQISKGAKYEWIISLDNAEFLF